MFHNLMDFLWKIELTLKIDLLPSLQYSLALCALLNCYSVYLFSIIQIGVQLGEVLQTQVLIEFALLFRPLQWKTIGGAASTHLHLALALNAWRAETTLKTG